MKKIVLITFVVTIIGCTYSVYSSGMPHLKTIAISEFANKTDEFQLESDLLDALSADFIQDGRLRLVDLNPDCRLQGEILDYSNKLATYSSSGVDEYEVRILYSVEFYDLVKNKEVWKISSLVFTQIYANDETSEVKTEADAVKEIEQDLFDRIMRESLEDW